MIWERSSLNSLFFFIFFSIILSTSLVFGPYLLLDNTDEDWVIGYGSGKEDAVQRRSRLRPRRSKKADLQPTLVCAYRCILRLPFLVLKYPRNDPLWK